MSERRDSDLQLALCIHTNVFALLIPAHVHLFMLAWLDPAGTATTLASGILAIIALAICCTLSSKYGLTDPVHEAGAFVFTVLVVSACFPSHAFWTASSPVSIMILCIPITMIVWKPALYWASSGNRATGCTIASRCIQRQQAKWRS